MLIMLLSSVLIIPVLMGLGKIMEHFAGPLFPGIAGKILAGTLGLSILWTVLAFFIPLNIYVETLTIFSGLFYFFKEKLYLEFYKFPAKDSFLIIIVALIILFCGSYYPYILDHYGYYISTIKWLAEYGLVKGISNLDLTLGQMSAWHIIQAGFSNFSDPFLRINAVLLIVYTLYIVEKKSWIQLCFLPVMLLFSQSPSPDLPVIVFSLIILNEILSGNKQTSLLLGFSVFVFTIKPTMIWLPILSFLYSVFIIKSNVRNLTLGIIILFLFFIKNLWTFGYPVFPIPIVDFGLSWKPNPEILKTSSQFAIQKTYDLQYTYEEIRNFSQLDYIKNWLSLDGIKSKINILFILSLSGFIIFSFIKKNKIISLICISLIIKSILILLFSAQYRFFIDVFFVILFVVLFNSFDKKKAIAVFSVAGLLIISFLSFPEFIGKHLPSYKMASYMGRFEKEQLIRPAVYENVAFDSFNLGNLKFNVSRNYPYNFSTPLPAITPNYITEDAKAEVFPQLIDRQNIRKGFIWKKMTMQQKKSTEYIINTIINHDKQN
ncbi:LIC_10190 family membrane protein [Chryseobacterium tongliaoense]|uniref:LIC_10190 family membrane protein n=1 Tax=Chryseobacterium tongliaoense TaxID=3240933 RepID=UPI00351821EF